MGTTVLATVVLVNAYLYSTSNGFLFGKKYESPKSM